MVDVPPKLSARARVFATGQGRKTDATDAHSVALVGTRMSGLRPVVNDEQLAVLRMLVDRRRPWAMTTPARSPSSTTCCWNSSPVARRRTCPPPRPRRCSRPSGPATSPARPAPRRRRADRRPRADLPRKKAANKELTELVAATGTGLTGPAGHRPLRCGPAARRGRRHHPLPRQQPLRVLDRHRTHRRLLRRQRAPPALPRRQPPDQPGPAHHGHRPAAQPHRRAAPTSTAPKPAARPPTRPCAASNDACPTSSTGRWSTTPPGTWRRAREGNRGNDSDSSATGSQPHTGSSDKPLPGPANSQA